MRLFKEKIGGSGAPHLPESRPRISAPSARRVGSCPLILLGVALSIHGGAALAVEPGVDLAAPRVAISTVDDSLLFVPANLVVEQGDYVRWRFSGTSVCHTTTSGPLCDTPSGLWNVTLGPSTCPNAPQTEFTRRFPESPGTIDYYCAPHCFLGMRGAVTVTTPIQVTASESSGQLTLAWAGGGGLYRVFRSGLPAFVGSGTVVLTPAAGTTLSTLSDSTEPAPGQVSFYLVMNQY
jgi:plastocyanin